LARSRGAATDGPSTPPTHFRGYPAHRAPPCIGTFLSSLGKRGLFSILLRASALSRQALVPLCWAGRRAGSTGSALPGRRGSRGISAIGRFNCISSLPGFQPARGAADPVPRGRSVPRSRTRRNGRGAVAGWRPGMQRVYAASETSISPAVTLPLARGRGGAAAEGLMPSVVILSRGANTYRVCVPHLMQTLSSLTRFVSDISKISKG
jgi:hypothetical protein